MIDRMQLGRVPRKHHIAFPREGGGVHHEQCLTREGFESGYTIAYHLERPHAQEPAPEVARGFALPRPAPPGPLAKRHYLSGDVARRGGAPLDARVPLLASEDVVLGVLFPDRSDDVYFANGDADDLYFVFEGGGTLRSQLGDVRFEAGDYVFVPRGLIHRFELSADAGRQWWLSMELRGGLHVPRQFRNELGQLRMDAPYTHRDFRRPEFVGPVDEGLRALVVKRGDRFHGYRYAHAPLDVVGWDGTVWPWAFPILNFQPRAGQTHLPPTSHGTFAARGALICSFVPRVVDFHPEAIPCPYPHASVDVDEVIFYCRGNFTSRRGVGPGSISLHPAGIPHGPHPGAYEGSIGHRSTDELAVMLDCLRPLTPTVEAAAVEDAGYMRSFLG